MSLFIFTMWQNNSHFLIILLTAAPPPTPVFAKQLSTLPKRSNSTTRLIHEEPTCPVVTGKPLPLLRLLIPSPCFLEAAALSGSAQPVTTVLCAVLCSIQGFHIISLDPYEIPLTYESTQHPLILLIKNKTQDRLSVLFEVTQSVKDKRRAS